MDNKNKTKVAPEVSMKLEQIVALLKAKYDLEGFIIAFPHKDQLIYKIENMQAQKAMRVSSLILLNLLSFEAGNAKYSDSFRGILGDLKIKIEKDINEANNKILEDMKKGTAKIKK